MIKLIRGNYTKDGGFSNVFLNRPQGWVHKLYKSYKYPDADSQRRGSIEDKLRRSQFQAELDAWKIVRESGELEVYTPKFLGQITVDCVLDGDGQDVSKLYLLDCCLKLELIKGKDYKFQRVPSRFEFVGSLFQKAGLFTDDMSYFLIDNEPYIKVINFATKYAYYEKEYEFITTGNIKEE